MNKTYIAASNTATNGVALSDTAGRDVVVWSVLVGLPTDAATLTFYDITNPVNGATTNIAYLLTQPTAAAGKDWVRQVDFPKGLPLNGGGNVVSNATNQVTVLWDYLDQSDQ